MDANILSTPTSLEEIRKAVTMCDTPELLLKIINEIDHQEMVGILAFSEQEKDEIFFMIGERSNQLAE